jgi:hypothetical protein
VPQGAGPEFKPECHKKKNTLYNSIHVIFWNTIDKTSIRIENKSVVAWDWEWRKDVSGKEHDGMS